MRELLDLIDEVLAERGRRSDLGLRRSRSPGASYASRRWAGRVQH